MYKLSQKIFGNPRQLLYLIILVPALTILTSLHVQNKWITTFANNSDRSVLDEKTLSWLKDYIKEWSKNPPDKTFGQDLDENAKEIKRFLNNAIETKLQQSKSNANLSKFCLDDRTRVQNLVRLNLEKMSLNDWDRLIMNPLTTGCQQFSRIGGHFNGFCNLFDGQKFVCLDQFQSQNCLVYSFGVGDDISFEKDLAKLNCTVYTHDPTVPPPKGLPSNIHFQPIGLKGHYFTDIKGRKYKPLLDILKTDGNDNSSIFYLKIDIEGSEIAGLPAWIDSGAFKNVHQFGMEIHETDNLANVRRLVESFKKLSALGFRLISYDPNICVPRKSSKSHVKFAEVVFMKHVGRPTNFCARSST